MDVKVEVLRHPEQADWERCKMLALNTIGKCYAGSEITDEWKRKILRAEHSPIRTLPFTVRMEVPYWVSVHFCRHKFGVEHYVTSQRNDRQDKYDRTTAPQGAIVTHVLDMNAQALAAMAQMRLCGQAAPETREVMREICRKILEVNPEFSVVLMPKCIAHGGECNEFTPCTLAYGKVTK